MSIYKSVAPEADLTQGDILDGCRILSWEDDKQITGGWRAVESRERVIVLAQACDVASPKISRLLIGVVHSAEQLVASGTGSAQAVRDQIRKHRQFGRYFLPKSNLLAESIVDLRDVVPVPRRMLTELAADGQRICRLTTPYREHLAQHFSVTYSRIGLPEPYATE